MSLAQEVPTNFYKEHKVQRFDLVAGGGRLLKRDGPFSGKKDDPRKHTKRLELRPRLVVLRETNDQLLFFWQDL